MSNQAAEAGLPVQATIQVGPEALDALTERLRPAIQDAVADALKHVALSQSAPAVPPTLTAPTFPVGPGVTVSATDREKAVVIKAELLDTKRTVDDRLLTDIRTVAHLLDVSPRTLSRLVMEGAMPRPTKVGRLLRWRADEIKAWVNADCPMLKDWRWPQDETSGTTSRKAIRR